MKRALLCLVLLLTLLLPVGSVRVDADGFPFMRSVKPLQAIAQADDGSLVLANICTISNINTEKHYWITAAHCVEGKDTRYLMGERITVVMRDVINDLAIVSTPFATAPAIKLAVVGPQLGNSVWMAGHPFGMTYPFLTGGTVAAVEAWLDGVPASFMFIQITGAPGNSGSPVVNTKGKLVSVIQIGSGRSFSPMMGGATFGVLEKYRQYWQ